MIRELKKSSLAELLQDVIEKYNLGALLSFPLVTLGKLQGVLQIVSRETHDFTFREIKHLETIADELAVGINRLRLQEELKHHAEQLEDEVQKRTHELVQSEKMAAVGQLVAGVAHEINNPLAYLMSNTSTIGEYLEDLSKVVEVYHKFPDDAQSRGILAATETVKRQEAEIGIDFILSHITKMIDTNQEGLNRIATIAKTLKRFARPDLEEKKPADINQGIKDTLVIAHNKLKYKADVIEEYGDVPLVKCNIGQINQVFMNIIMNAADAIEDQGEIRIKTEANNQKVTVTIQDTGKGIDPEIMERIFNPFFTRKIGGTGLGLSISYRIIEEHSGKIDVESKVGEGTTIKIHLPLEAQEVGGTV